MDVTCCSDSSEQHGNEITPLTCHGPLVQVPLINAIHFSLACLLSLVADINGTGAVCGRGGVSLRYCNLLSRMLQCQWNVKHLSKSLNLLLDNCCDREDGSCEQLSRGVVTRGNQIIIVGSEKKSIHYSLYFQEKNHFLFLCLKMCASKAYNEHT